MTEWDETLKVARAHVEPRFGPARERALRQRVDRALARRSLVRRAAPVLLLAAVVMLLVGVRLGHWLEPEGGQAVSERPSIQKEPLLALADGSRISAISPEARVTPVEVGARATTLRLEAGSARFEVAHQRGGRFRVLCEDVVVSVVGTIFSVEKTSQGVRVRVEHGRVEVAWPGGERSLSAGEEVVRRRPSPEPVVAVRSDPVPTVPAPPSPSSSAASHPRRAPVSWQSLASDGDYPGAFSRIKEEGPDAVKDEPGDLLFAADVARLSGHPERAVPWLERVVKAHTGDSRASLAAFTLGRTLLDALGRPREAAEAFATAHRLAPGGAIAQDALAREVESWSRAGEVERARARARRYLELYPNGRRKKLVRYHGGLD